MADKKISALPAASTPLAGTEILPIVQGGTTDQVSVANLTAGRAVSASQLTLSTENLVIGTAGKGIDFSANTHAAGMTSELLTWYEEGEWTPTQGAGLTVVGAFSSRGRYTRIGRLVQVSGTVLGATSVAVTAGTILCGGLPFASNASQGSAGSMNNDSINVSGGVFTSINNVYATSSISATAAIPFTVTYFV